MYIVLYITLTGVTIGLPRHRAVDMQIPFIPFWTFHWRSFIIRCFPYNNEEIVLLLFDFALLSWMLLAAKVIACNVIILIFSLWDPISVSSGSSSPSAQRHLPSAQHVVLNSAANDTICCVISLTCDAPRRGGKQRYDDFLSVVHFRKPVNNRKIGSAWNGHPVI